MDFPLSRALVPRLVVMEECASTNSELVERAAGGREVEFSTLVTTNQTHGRGRLGRTWIAPPGQTLATSVLLRPASPGGKPLALEHYGWLPLVAGLAMTRAVAGLCAGVTLKWPNDVLIDGLKVAGLLAELLPDGNGVVLGAGLNLTIAEADLPTPSSTSLILHGVDGENLPDVALSAYLHELRRAYADLREDAARIRSQVSALCSTLGRQVNVELPGGDTLAGTAVDLDESGRLRIKTTTDAPLTAVAAGDVTHVR